jgi:hypothetical protein
MLPNLNFNSLAADLRRLAADPGARIAMSRAASSVTDGKGALRTVQTLIDKVIAPRVGLK